MRLIRRRSLLIPWVALVISLLGAGAAAGLAVPGAVFDGRPLQLALADVQTQVDYRIPVPQRPPAGASLDGAFMLVPPHSVMFPADPADPAAGAAADRRRPVALRYSTPHGTFIVFVAGLSVNAAAGDLQKSVPYGLSQVSGPHELIGGQEFAVRRDITATVPGSNGPSTGLTSLTFNFSGLQWRGQGQLISALVTVMGTIPEPELVDIALSLR